MDFKHASIVEGVRFTAQVGVPNVVQGLFRKREAVVSAIDKLPADHLAYRLVEGLARKYGPDPFWVRVGAEEALLVTHPDDLRVVLGGSPSPFASDPDAKRKGMAAFQPDALTISRGDLWADRRAFAEAVLDTGPADAPAGQGLRGRGGRRGRRVCSRSTGRSSSRTSTSRSSG